MSYFLQIRNYVALNSSQKQKKIYFQKYEHIFALLNSLLLPLSQIPYVHHKIPTSIIEFILYDRIPTSIIESLSSIIESLPLSQNLGPVTMVYLSVSVDQQIICGSRYEKIQNVFFTYEQSKLRAREFLMNIRLIYTHIQREYIFMYMNI